MIKLPTKRELLEERTAEELKQMARDKGLSDYSDKGISKVMDEIEESYQEGEIKKWIGDRGGERTRGEGMAEKIKFKRVFQAFFVLSVSALSLDFLMTNYGFTQYHAFMEINPHIIFFMRYMDPTSASSIVLTITLSMILIGYWSVRTSFKNTPYCSGLKSVWKHLLYSEKVKSHDLAIFALISLYTYFSYAHIMGAWSWIELFIM